MPASVSSMPMVMLLASTSSGVRAALAQAMAQIMSVKPGPSVPEVDRELAGDADEGVGGVRHRALVPSAERGDPGRGDGVDDRDSCPGHVKSAATPFFLARAREDLGAGHREGERLRHGADVEAANSAGTRIGAMPLAAAWSAAPSAPAAVVLPECRGGRGAGARHRVLEEPPT